MPDQTTDIIFLQKKNEKKEMTFEPSIRGCGCEMKLPILLVRNLHPRLFCYNPNIVLGGGQGSIISKRKKHLFRTLNSTVQPS